jgi:hypothetical protein
MSISPEHRNTAIHDTPATSSDRQHSKGPSPPCRDGKSAAKAAAQIPTDAVDEIFYVNGGADGWEVTMDTLL